MRWRRSGERANRTAAAAPAGLRRAGEPAATVSRASHGVGAVSSGEISYSNSLRTAGLAASAWLAGITSTARSGTAFSRRLRVRRRCARGVTASIVGPARRTAGRAGRHPAGSATDDSNRSAQICGMHGPGQSSLMVCLPWVIRTVHCDSHRAPEVCHVPVTDAKPRCTLRPST